MIRVSRMFIHKNWRMGSKNSSGIASSSKSYRIRSARKLDATTLMIS